MIIPNYHNLFFTGNQPAIMSLFSFLTVLAITLLKTVVVAGVAFWFSLVVFHLYPPLGHYLARLFDFDK